MAISAQKKIIALFVGLIAFIVILAGAGFLVYRVYWKVDESGVTRTFAKAHHAKWYREMTQKESNK